ncbi:MAG: LPS translocon maturation chaperone LptM [Henriciella sp.]|nr:lipoprotein [Hyphomonadaceae bacterium]
MKRVIKTGLAISALAALASCGLRGDLETPPPIFSDPPSEEAQLPVDAAVQFAAAEIDDGRVYYNSLGGEIPKPAPDVDVEEESMGEVSPG